VRPPRPLQPLVESDERKFAHSLKLVLPRITAPAWRSFSTTNESRAGIEPTKASDPAVVVMRSCVSRLSLMSSGMPCKGPRGPFALRSRSSSRAMFSASGLSSMMELSLGPLRSMCSMRSRYLRTKETAEYLPDSRNFWRSVMVASSSSNGLTSSRPLRLAARDIGIEKKGPIAIAVVAVAERLKKSLRFIWVWTAFGFVRQQVKTGLTIDIPAHPIGVHIEVQLVSPPVVCRPAFWRWNTLADLPLGMESWPPGFFEKRTH
jgi:hypothetical protein